MGSRDLLSLGKHSFCRGNFELARPETHPAPGAKIVERASTLNNQQRASSPAPSRPVASRRFDSISLTGAHGPEAVICSTWLFSFRRETPHPAPILAGQ